MTNRITQLTAETITNEQIEALRAEARAAQDWEMDEVCERALSLAPHFADRDREACARALNTARAMDD